MAVLDVSEKSARPPCPYGGWRLETHRLSTGLDRAAAGDSVGTRPYIQVGVHDL